MNIDDLATAIESIAGDKEVHDLAEIIKGWKTSDATVSQLGTMVDRYISQVWFKSDAIHKKIYSAWQSFKDETILDIGGMTMNERLYFFGLLGHFDTATENEQDIIYTKLEAKK